MIPLAGQGYDSTAQPVVAGVCEVCARALDDIHVEVLVYAESYLLLARHQLCAMCAAGWLEGAALAA